MKMAGLSSPTTGVLGKHFAAHKAASGHDFSQSGSDCFGFGEHGMPSAIPAMSPIAVSRWAAMAAAADGAAIGAVRRLRIARVESNRGKQVQIFTLAAFHTLPREKRRQGSHPRAVNGTDCRESTRAQRAHPGHRLNIRREDT